MKTRTVLAVFAGLFVLLVLSFTWEWKRPSQAAEALNAHQIAELNKPGTVMIYTVWKAHVEVPEPDLDQEKLPLLMERVRNEIQQGRIPQTEQAIKEAIIREALTNFLDYVKPRAIRM